MCDYSLQHVKSRPAKIGDQLTTRDFGLGTRGFAASEDKNVAVCVHPGTELSFANEVTCVPPHVGLAHENDPPQDRNLPAVEQRMGRGSSRRSGVPGRPDRTAHITGRRSEGHCSSVTRGSR